MAQASKTFNILIGILIASIIGLAGAVYSQKKNLERTEMKIALEKDLQKMSTIVQNAEKIKKQMPTLDSKFKDVEKQWIAIQNRFYNSKDKLAYEESLKNCSSQARLTLQSIETSTSSTIEGFKIHEFSIKMVGSLTNIPIWADCFFKAKKYGVIKKISASSPEYQFNNVNINAVLNMFEPVDPVEASHGKFPTSDLEVKTTYPIMGATTSDPVYGSIMQEVENKGKQLEVVKQDLLKTSELEAKTAGWEKQLAESKSIDSKTNSNKKIVSENLPKLFVKVKTSQLGSAAMLVKENEAKFPETAGDE